MSGSDHAPTRSSGSVRQPLQWLLIWRQSIQMITRELAKVEQGIDRLQDGSPRKCGLAEEACQSDAGSGSPQRGPRRRSKATRAAEMARDNVNFAEQLKAEPGTNGYDRSAAQRKPRTNRPPVGSFGAEAAAQNTCVLAHYRPPTRRASRCRRRRRRKRESRHRLQSICSLDSAVRRWRPARLVRFVHKLQLERAGRASEKAARRRPFKFKPLNRKRKLP